MSWLIWFLLGLVTGVTAIYLGLAWYLGKAFRG